MSGPCIQALVGYSQGVVKAAFYLDAQRISFLAQSPCLPSCVPWNYVNENATLLLTVS